jgi:hypothetical protein
VARYDDDDDDDLTEEEREELEEEREDLATALMQARNKPRYFAIITKGPDVLAVLAQKRPFRDGPLRQERREKKGKKIIQGVCQGDGGARLIFKVTGERPKIKKAKLRQFISDTTGLMTQPRFASAATTE